MILQACIDDSATYPTRNDGIYLLAGLIASADEWLSFSDKWDDELRRPPGLAYFKLSQALSMRDEFDPSKGWTEALRDVRVLALAHIVRSHVKAGYTVIVARDDYIEFLRVHAERHIELRDPYYFCFFQIIDAVTESRPWLGGSCGLDYIFDEQGVTGTHAVDYWRRLKARMPFRSPGDLGSVPIFKKDTEFPPLQAADLWAGLVRGIEEEMLRAGRIGIRQPWLDVFDGMKVNERKYSRDHLMNLGASLSSRL